jgi:hypothetical protein
MPNWPLGINRVLNQLRAKQAVEYAEHRALAVVHSDKAR